MSGCPQATLRDQSGRNQLIQVLKACLESNNLEVKVIFVDIFSLILKG